jgi:ankyrin repeat protein
MTLLGDFAKAIERNDVAYIESLLKNAPVDANARMPRKRHPPALVLAAKLNLKEIVELLLRFGARIDDIDDEGRTACHLVAEGDVNADDALVLPVLLAHRPNLEIKCGKGYTSLETSFMYDNGRIATMLIDAGASLESDSVQERLCRFASTSTSAIQTLLRRGVIIKELRDGFGSTPLHVAASPVVLDMLLNECGVDLEARDGGGFTCLHAAMGRRNIDAVRFLITAGVNLDSVGNYGRRTLLHKVVDEAYTILLLAAGADVHARDELGRTPCNEAASTVAHRPVADVRSIVNAMLAAGADLDAVDLYGNSARQLLADHQQTFDDTQTANDVETARREIAKVRLDFVRHRAWQVCIGLQSLGLDALQMCEILLHVCGSVAPLIPFHQWWKIATTMKHFIKH